MESPRFKHTCLSRPVWLTASLCLTLAIGLAPPCATAESASEYAIKAAIIFKIAKFVSWPERAFSNKNEALSVCMQKDDQIAEAMSALSGKPIQGRVFSVRYIEKNQEIPMSCQILFLSNLQDQNDLLDNAANKPILTIGDNKNFTALGGVIGLEINSDRVQFTINTIASESAGLEISSQLLQLAKIMDHRQGT